MEVLKKSTNGQWSLSKSSLSSTDVDSSHHIPYLGGYSNDGKTIYIDSRFPKTIKGKDGKTIDCHKYLTIHEMTERRLLEAGLDYNASHNIAEATEEAAMRLDGVDPKDYYGVLYEVYNHTLRDFDPDKVPKDLDLKPYKDDKLTSVVKRIEEARNAK